MRRRRDREMFLLSDRTYLIQLQLTLFRYNMKKEASQVLLTVGDIVRMRKPHPCGNDLWKITYVGADIKMCCEKCGRTVMLDRPTFDKRVKKLVQSAVQDAEA